MGLTGVFLSEAPHFESGLLGPLWLSFGGWLPANKCVYRIEKRWEGEGVEGGRGGDAWPAFG